MERDIDETTGTDRGGAKAAPSGATSNTGGAANLGGTSGLGGMNAGAGSAGYATGGAGSTNYGSTGATQSAAGAGLGLGGESEGPSAGTNAFGGAAGMGGTQGTADRARDAASQAREKLGEAGTKARDMKSKLEQTLADRLEAGASRLRERGTSAGGASGSGSMTPAYASGGASSTAADGAASGENVAKGMEATADWLRNGDLKQTIESQARTNPGRTLLVALGVGYLLGKAIRR